jgi:ATP-grasp domain
MILIIACNTDPIAQYFAKFLLKNKYKFLLIDQRLLGSNFILKSDHFIYKSHKFFYKDFSGVYLRLSSPSSKLKLSDPKVENDVALLVNIINIKFTNIVSTTCSQASNYSKLYQLSICNVSALKIPESFVIANNKISILPNDIQLIYKSLSSIRSTPVLLDRDVKQNNIPQEPVLFQHFVQGHNIRIHVMQDICFASLILTCKVDYRYDELSTKIQYNLPKNIKTECVNLTKQLGLKISGIDLIKLEGNYYLLEVNPSPGYCTFEYNFEISKKLAQILVGN